MKKLKEIRKIRKIGCQYGLEVEDLKEEDMPMI